MKIQKIILIVFLGVQGIVPVWALVVPGHSARTDFTWDMFAVRRDCSPCEIGYTIGDQQPGRVSWGLRAPPLLLDPRPGFFSGLTTTPQERGGAVPRGLWDTLWNAPAFHQDSVDAREDFDQLGGNFLLVYPSSTRSAGMFSLNTRAAPQVARLKSEQRMRMMGEEVCAEMTEAFESALQDPIADRWLRRQAETWELSGRRLRVHAVCECAYNGGDPIPVVEPGADLCGGAN